MCRRNVECYFLAVAMLLFVTANWVLAIDNWDASAPDDDTSANTRNVLVPGDSPQRHDVQAVSAVPDQDWFRLVVIGGHSYEVRVGGRQDSCFDFVGNNFQVLQSDASTLITTGVDVLGASQISSYRATFIPITDDVVFVHLTGAASCTATAEYTIQVFDTTLFGAPYFTAFDFDTFITIQNTTNTNISATLKFIDLINPAATFTAGVTVPMNRSTVVSTRVTVPVASSTQGAVIISHNGPAGALKALGVASSGTSGQIFQVIFASQ